MWQINFICVSVFVLATLNSSDVVETDTLKLRDSRLQNLWILPKFFQKMSLPLPKLNFFQISGIFSTCFHCVLPTNTKEEKLVELKKFY